MIETAHIDIKTVIEQLCCIAWVKPARSHGQIVYKGGPCPFCHVGTDRFAVFTEGEKPHFYCGIHGNGCGAHGDVIAFVQQIKGYTTAGPAIQELREMGYPVGDETITISRPSREGGVPGQKWQDRGNALIHAAQKYLWSSKGKQALDYLRMRGLADETIKRFRLGYCPDWFECRYAEWGIESEEKETFWFRPSILIPCYESYEKEVLWGINRRLTSYTEKELARQRQGERLPPRYMQVKGSSNGLFNVESIRPGEPLFMTEGEFDAMVLAQETGYAVVATGSTKGAQLSRWIASLSLASHLIVSFDDDQGKGENAAEYWTDLFEDKATFYPPWSKDVNEMLQQGQDINLWAFMGVEIVSDRDAQDPIANQGDTASHPASVGVPLDQDEQEYLEYLRAPQAIDQARERLARAMDLLCELGANGLSLVYEANGCIVWTPELEPFRELIEQRDTELRDILGAPKPCLTQDEILTRFKDALPGWTIEVLEPGQDLEAYKRSRLVNWKLKRAPMQKWLVKYWVEHGELPEPYVIERKKEEMGIA